MWDNNAQGIQEICNYGHDQRVKDVEKGPKKCGVSFEGAFHNPDRDVKIFLIFKEISQCIPVIFIHTQIPC